MTRLPCGIAAVSMLFAPALTAQGQSFNLAFGPANVQPDSSYAAAGLPGYWNTLTAANGTTTYNLVDINGTITNARLLQIGGTGLLNINDGGTSGSDQALLDYFLVTYTPTLESCLFFYDLQNGIYEVIPYSWMPRSPNVQANVSSDEEPGYPHVSVGGAWTGHHQNMVTFSRHYCNVGPGFSGRLRVHSGIVPGAQASNGAALNGIQIRLLPPASPADLNCDGELNAIDVEAFVKVLTNREAYYSAEPTCNILNGDMNGDWQINLNDAAGFVQAILAG